MFAAKGGTNPKVKGLVSVSPSMVSYRCVLAMAWSNDIHCTSSYIPNGLSDPFCIQLSHSCSDIL